MSSCRVLVRRGTVKDVETALARLPTSTLVEVDDLVFVFLQEMASAPLDPRLGLTCASEADLDLVRSRLGDFSFGQLIDPPPAPRPYVGLGDVISRITRALGISECAACRKRKARLNRIRMPSIGAGAYRR